MKNLESVVGSGEIVFIVGDKSAAIIGRDDFRGQKMFAGKRALAGA
jgi:hypothetical protein